MFSLAVWRLLAIELFASFLITKIDGSTIRRWNAEEEQIDRILQDIILVPQISLPTTKPVPMDLDADIEAILNGPYAGPDVPITTNAISSISTSTYKEDDDEEPTDRIIGGEETEPHPYFAILLYQQFGNWKFAGCGATLISNCHLLTAAHCVMDREYPITGLYINAYRPYNSNDRVPFHFSSVEDIFVRSDYDDDLNINDISVIRMETCLNITEYPPIEPANPFFSPTDGLEVDILGMGRQAEDSASGATKTLREAHVPFISPNTCKQYFPDRITDAMCCAGYANGGVDACQGDSGSGLTYTNPDTSATVVLGIVSWGIGCGRPGFPGVYVKVQYFFFWLQEVVCADPEIDSSISWCKQMENKGSEEDSTTAGSIEEGETSNSESQSGQNSGYHDGGGGTGPGLTLRFLHCSIFTSCGLCEGDCHNDDHCVGDLQCFQRRGVTALDPVPGCSGLGNKGVDYCYNPNYSYERRSSSDDAGTQPSDEVDAEPSIVEVMNEEKIVTKGRDNKTVRRRKGRKPKTQRTHGKKITRQKVENLPVTTSSDGGGRT